MPRWSTTVLGLVMMLASAHAWAEDATAAPTASPPAATAGATTTADPRSRFRMQRVEGPQGAGAKMTPVGATQGAGAKMTPASVKESRGAYRVQRVSDLNTGTPQNTATATAAGGMGSSIGLPSGQRRSSNTSGAAPALNATSFRGGRAIGGGTKSSPSSPSR